MHALTWDRTIVARLLVVAWPLSAAAIGQQPRATEPPESAASMSHLFEDDFEHGLDRWELSDPSSWALRPQEPGGSALEILTRESGYQPPVRSPGHVALMRDVQVEDFDLIFRVRSTQDTGNHRDCCVFFGYQDPQNFYYVHLGAKPDPASSQIMIVQNAPRRPLTDNQQPVPWDDGWHVVKLERRLQDGAIRIYFDNLETPLMQVRDKTFGRGRVGLGSFDDRNAFDDVRLLVPGDSGRAAAGS